MTLIPRAYVSGPMTGIPDFNYPEFNRVAGKLRVNRGWHVVNPAESFSGNQDLDFSTYMRWDITQLLTCDTIVLLPGWEHAVGAVFEVAIGSALGLEILEYRDEAGGFTLRPPLPFFDTDRDRLGFVLGVPKERPEVARVPLAGINREDIRSSAGPEPMSTWAEADNGLLKAADHIVNGDRQRTYGHPINHHTATAELWSAYLSRASGERVNVRPSDVSILMILDKVSRVGGGDKVDNVLDIAGYAQVHAKVRAKQEEGHGLLKDRSFVAFPAGQS